MHTPELPDTSLAATPPANRADAEPLVAATGAADMSCTLLVACAASIAGLATASVAAWQVTPWIGLTVACVAGVMILTGLLAAVSSQSRGNQLELERLVEALGHSRNVHASHFQLSGRWRRIGQRIIDAQAAVAHQAHDRHSSGQKLELAQRVAQAGQRRAEAIINSLGDAVLVTNAFGELLLANAQAARLFQMQVDQACGRPARDVLPHGPLARMIEQAGQAGGPRRHSEELPLATNGQPHWYKVTTSVVSDGAAGQLGIATVLRDITSEKAAQARSAEFVSAVSHEIKTPLSSIKAYAEMLADGDAEGDPETQQKFLGIIEAQTDRMTRMLESMLDMARIESGVVRAEKKPLSLNELLEGGIKLMQPTAAAKRIDIETQLSRLYLGVEGDADMLGRAIMNLLSNAIKYTDDAGRITVRSQMLHDQAMIEIVDTGRGIPPEAIGRLFEKFYRVKENAAMAPGTGLGLSLVKHVVEEVHGGRIEIDSQVGQGSTFRVILKLAGATQSQRPGHAA